MSRRIGWFIAVVVSSWQWAGAQRGLGAELWEFYSPSCGPCRQMEPILAELAERGIPIRRIDVSRHPQLARQFGITGLPTFVVVRDGQAGPRLVGATTTQALEELFRRGASISGAGATAASGLPDSRMGGVPAGTERERPRGESVQASTTGWNAAGGARGDRGAEAGEASASGGDVGANEASVWGYARSVSELLAATVRLRVRDKGGQSCGSGTIVDARGGEALILTCGHIFRESKGAGRIEVDLFGPHWAENVVGRLVTYDLSRDLGLVAIRPPGPVVVARVAPAGTRLERGQTVIAVGCDHGSRPTAQVTRVTGVDKYVGPANLVVAGMPSQGRSGGGLFTQEGWLIGVCNAADPTDGEGLYSALAAIHELLDQRGLAFVYRGPWPSPLGGQLAGEMVAGGRSGSSAGELVPVTAVAVDGGKTAGGTGGGSAAGTGGQGLAPEAAELSPWEEALLATLARHMREGAEVLWVVRPREGSAGRGEVLVAEELSPAFWARLAEMQQGLPQRTSCQVPAEGASSRGGKSPQRAEEGPESTGRPNRRVIFQYRSQPGAVAPALGN